MLERTLKTHYALNVGKTRMWRYMTLSDGDFTYDMLSADGQCPICKKPFSEHSLDQATECAIVITKGGRS